MECICVCLCVPTKRKLTINQQNCNSLSFEITINNKHYPAGIHRGSEGCSITERIKLIYIFFFFRQQQSGILHFHRYKSQIVIIETTTSARKKNRKKCKAFDVSGLLFWFTHTKCLTYDYDNFHSVSSV